MASGLIRTLLDELPPKMQESVEGYVDAVAAALPEIERDARVKLENKKELFLYITAVRKIWAAVNGQYWIMNDCVKIAIGNQDANLTGEAGIFGFRIGRDDITQNSEAFHESEALKTSLEKMLSTLKIDSLVIPSISLAELARLVVDDADGPHKNS